MCNTKKIVAHSGPCIACSIRNKQLDNLREATQVRVKPIGIGQQEHHLNFCVFTCNLKIRQQTPWICLHGFLRGFRHFYIYLGLLYTSFRAIFQTFYYTTRCVVLTQNFLSVNYRKIQRYQTWNIAKWCWKKSLHRKRIIIIRYLSWWSVRNIYWMF